MEPLFHTEPVPMTGGGGEPLFVCLRVERPAPSLRRFQRFIETSDWDERIVCREPLFNKICLATVILSGMALLPLVVSVLFSM